MVHASDPILVYTSGDINVQKRNADGPEGRDDYRQAGMKSRVRLSMKMR
jgi:hypothetical protein